MTICGATARDINPRIAYEPNIPVRLNSGPFQCHENWIGRRFVARRIGRPHQIAFEIPVPAQLVGLCPKMAAGFIADDAQMTTQFFQQLDQFLSAVFSNALRCTAR